jgi:uncharacterized protein DUF2510
MSTWEYRAVAVGTDGFDRLESTLNALGAVGWEVCGFASVDKTIGLNSMTALVKRERPPLPAPEARAAAWHPDPLERHERRWWDGIRWSEHVLDGDQQGTDWPVPAT